MASILVLLCVNLRIMPLCLRERVLKEEKKCTENFLWREACDREGERERESAKTKSHIELAKRLNYVTCYWFSVRH